MSEQQTTMTTGIDWEHPYSGETLKRREQSYRERKRAWYDPGMGLMLLPGGWHDGIDVGGYDHLLTWLDGLADGVRPEIVMVLGGTSATDTPSREELQAPAADGWHVSMRYDESHEQYDRAHVTYSRNGRTIELRLAAEWLGDCRSVDIAARAWRRLGDSLRSQFLEPRIQLISTPGRTGMDLLERTLPRQKESGWSYAYPVLSSPIRELLMATNGQGRNELFDHGGDTIDGLYCLDARWMYAACLSNLPSGDVLHDDCPDFAGYAPGFYYVTGKVPQGWGHIGLIASQSYRGEEREREWPRRPGATFQGWVSSGELDVARQCGWECHIRERMLWPSPTSDPCKMWLQKLRALRAQAEAEATERDPVARVVSYALRSIVLHTVGMWHRREAWQYHTIPSAERVELPRGAELLTDRGGKLVYRVRVPLHDERYSHPEWSATVWGRARARLNVEALRWPFADVVALRTDAVWLTRFPDGHVDDYKPGTFRVKGGGLHGPLAAPREEWQLLDLMRQARGK